MKKNISLFAAIFFVLLFTHCTNLQEGHLDDTNIRLIWKTTKKGNRYGAKYGNVISIPPIFPYYAKGIDDNSIYFFPENPNICYLFEKNGTEILSGKESGSKELGFEPIPIMVKEKGHQILDPAERYFGNIFYPGKYYLFALADGNVHALFAYQSHYFPFGSYQKFFPGNTGFSYKRANKWGATAAQMESRQTLKETISEQEIFPAEYDEIIEVVKSRTSCVWFARKGNNWVSRAIGEDGIVRPAAVDTKLLNRVRNMRIQNKAKGRRDGMWTVLIPGQRIGTKEASVVFF